VFSIGINRAVVLLAEKKAGGGKGRFRPAAATVLKELGEHPSEGGKVQVLSGRYGPYVKHGDVNATLTRGKDPAALSLEEAVQLIAERRAKGPGKPKGRRGKAGKTPPPPPAPAASKRTRKKAAEGEAGAPVRAKGKSKGKARKVNGTREAAE
jgi:DNA topoisomerase-1